jgi:hypothetical protein
LRAGGTGQPRHTRRTKNPLFEDSQFCAPTRTVGSQSISMPRIVDPFDCEGCDCEGDGCDGCGGVLCGGSSEGGGYWDSDLGCGVRVGCEGSGCPEWSRTLEGGERYSCCLCLAKQASFDEGPPDVESLCKCCRKRYSQPPWLAKLQEDTKDAETFRAIRTHPAVRKEIVKLKGKAKCERAKAKFEKDRSSALARMEAGKKDFVVGGIVEKRKVEGQAHLLVRWKGFDASQDTWESRAKMMRVVPNMVKKFELELAKRLRKQSRAEKNKRLVGYMLFSQHYRSAATKVAGKDIRTIAKELGVMWNALPEEDKATWKAGKVIKSTASQREAWARSWSQKYAGAAGNGE